MAAWALHQLTGLPCSVSGHAYDLFEKGGDGWLRIKTDAAEWIRTSTQAGRDRLIEKGAPAEKVIVVRRGLPELPPWNPPQPITSPYRFLSVGRMVEKMGFDRQIPLFAALKAAGIDFSVEWIGDGPGRPALEKAVEAAGLGGTIRFCGQLPYEEVEKAYVRNDIFVFTGRVDRRGDRAGLPNAVAEAMAWGLLVFATDVGAVREAIHHESNGFIWEAEPDAGDILRALRDPGLQNHCRIQAREWIDGNYQLRNNLGPLHARLSL
jgi:glycosyltransferase involved in cell wall biosynthesis